MPPLSGRLWFPEAPFFFFRLTFATDEQGAEPPFRARPGRERTFEQRVEPLTRVHRLDLGAEPRSPRASADRPGDVFAADAKRTGFAVVRAEHVEVASSEGDAFGKFEIVQDGAGREPVDRLADEPEVAEHPAGDHHSVDHPRLDAPGKGVHVLDITAAEHRDAHRLLHPRDLRPVGGSLVLLTAGP